eukprot:s6082_g2.t1
MSCSSSVAKSRSTRTRTPNSLWQGCSSCMTECRTERTRTPRSLRQASPLAPWPVNFGTKHFATFSVPLSSRTLRRMEPNPF